MTLRKEIGKIQRVSFGHGGYQDAMIGLSLTLGSDSGWGVGAFVSGFWSPALIECSEHCKWTEEDRKKAQNEMVEKICALLKDAKVDTVDKLLGKPVEVTFDGMTLKDWRILTEAI